MGKYKKEKSTGCENGDNKKKDEKRDRLAVRLVENLKKRKLQTRNRSV